MAAPAFASGLRYYNGRLTGPEYTVQSQLPCQTIGRPLEVPRTTGLTGNSDNTLAAGRTKILTIRTDTDLHIRKTPRAEFRV